MVDSYPPQEQWEVEEIAIAATAGNVATNITPGAGYRYIVLYGQITIVCDGTVADRYIQFHVRNTGGTPISPQYEAAAATAGQTRRLGFYPDVVKDGPAKVTENIFSFGFLPINGTDILYFNVRGGVAGDSYSGNFRVYKLKL